VVIAAVGPARYELATDVPSGLRLPDGFRNPRVVMPGILTIEGPKCLVTDEARSNPQSQIHNPQSDIARFCHSVDPHDPLSRFRWLVIVDDSQFVAESLRNFLWVTFTRTNPAADIHGVDEFIDDKHWGCGGPLVIDARLKPHHAPPLVEDPKITRRVNALAAAGGPLHGII
jgi:4-hydroxy-3-polyprenylbenzoate decarboxylase